MKTNKGFDNDLYLREQTKAIKERMLRFNNKLYLEFGGKLLFDYHAARVLPGYDPNIKMRLLQELKDQTDIILCIYAGDIERRKMRADFGISYDADALKLIDDLRDRDLDVSAVVITRYDNQPAANLFRDKLERRNIKVYCHRPTRGYPADINTIVGSEGYGANPYIQTSKPLVVVTGPGPGSGKLATCLSQLYHDHKQGHAAGYAKFETFPIWNLPLKHPVNMAYEAATADLGDLNLIDPFHLEARHETAVNYNRDIDAFPLLKAIWERITTKESIYRSPTEMGVNRAGFAITDDMVVRDAARQEIIRRFFRYACEYAMGLTGTETIRRVETLMLESGLSQEDRRVVLPARQAAQDAGQTGKGNAGVYCGAAIECRDGAIITGKNSPLMHAASSAIINAIKHHAGLPDNLHLISATIMQSIGAFKRDILERQAESLSLEETLIALSISSTTNPAAQLAMEKLKTLRGCEIHLTHIPAPGDEAGLRRLGVNLTSDPHFATRNLFLA